MTKTTTDDFQTKPWKQMLQSHYYHSLQKKRWISDQNRPHDSDIMMKIMTSIPPNEWCGLLRQGHFNKSEIRFDHL